MTGSSSTQERRGVVVRKQCQRAALVGLLSGSSVLTYVLFGTSIAGHGMLLSGPQPR